MTTPHDEYRQTREWRVIQKALTELEANRNVVLTTSFDHVVGYLSQALLSAESVSCSGPAVAKSRPQKA
jgi:hypothetical protein